jgi:hypothetical protein
MKKTADVLASMFDIKSILATPKLPSFFVLILIFLILISVIVLNAYGAPPEAYSVIVALVPIASGIVNNLTKPGL